MLFTIIGVIVALLIIISVQTLWLHPKPKKDILKSDFSEHSDQWYKKPENKNLIILLHGMYSSPEVFHETAEKLVEEGWDVYVPVLPNASKSSLELSKQESFQWEDSLRVAFHRALIYNQGYEKIVLGGHSQGGSLALSIAPSMPFLDGLIVVASPLFLIHKKNSLFRNISLIFVGLIYFFVPKKGIFLTNKNAEQKALVEGHYNPKEFFFGLTLHSMKLGLKQTRKNISRITYPCLFIYEKGDRTTNYKDTEILTKNIQNSKLITLETPLSLDPFSGRHKLFSYIHTKERVKNEISTFLQSIG